MMSSKWIPVTEELPPMDTEVLVYCTTVTWYDDGPESYAVRTDGPQILLGHYSQMSLCWFCETVDDQQHIEPTHWMPLPDFPNGEEE